MDNRGGRRCRLCGGTSIPRLMSSLPEVGRGDGFSAGPLTSLGKKDYAPGSAMHPEVDIDHLRLATGWSPTIPLEVGLAETIALIQFEQDY
jgi:nucleoside-diphosphate-sugar epimerase